MDINVKDVESIEFGIYSPDEIRQMSVVCINSSKLYGPGTVYDEKMGKSMDSGDPCVTCGLSVKKCPGHFGHIELNENIIHPLFFRKVLHFLKCFCASCSRLLLLKDQIEINGFSKLRTEKRFEKILEKINKVDVCAHCSNYQPSFSYSPIDNSLSMSYKGTTPISIVMSVDDIKKIFDNIIDEDVITLGFNPKKIHPRNLILTVFPVIPPCSRPFVIADGNICDDDLTNQILEIIKANNNLKNDSTLSESKRMKNIQSLKFRILTFFDNSKGRAKHPTNGCN